MPNGKHRFYAQDGTVLVGGKVFTYDAGTVTPRPTYSDQASTIPNTNPVILDARGEALIRWDGAYKYVLKTAADVTIETIDDFTPATLLMGGGSGAGMIGFLYAAVYGANTVGKWLQDLALSTGSTFIGFIQAGAGAVLRTSRDKMRELFSAKDFGAVGNGVSLDAVFIQAAHDALVATGKFGVLTLPQNCVFKCNVGLTVNVSLVRIDGNGSKLDFSGMAAGTAITLVGKGSGTPYAQSVGGIRGIEVAGPGATSVVNGIEFNNTPEAGTSHNTVESCPVHDFQIGHVFKNNAYCINVLNSGVYACGTGTQQPSGFANYGERISYIGSDIFNCTTVAIDMQNASGEYVMTNSSFDYNVKVANISGGRVNLMACHVEASTYASEPFVLSGATGATLLMNGGWMLCTGANAVSIVNANTTAGKGGGAFFRDVFMNNLTSASYFATGTGNVEVSNPILYDTPANFPVLLRLDQSLAIDGGFEQATPADVFITADTAAITSRLAGTDIVLSSVAVNPRSGARSLKMAKAFGAGSACGFAMVAPLRAGRRNAGVRLWYSKLGAQTGTMFVSYAFVALRDSPTVPAILKTSTAIGTTNVVLGAAAVAYTAIVGGFDLGRAPAWATHIAVIINADNVGAGDIYFDDFEAYEF